MILTSTAYWTAPCHLGYIRSVTTICSLHDDLYYELFLFPILEENEHDSYVFGSLPSPPPCIVYVQQTLCTWGCRSIFGRSLH